jgi:hypothetical protein
VAAIPITAIVLMYGGASIDDIVRQQLVLLSTAVALGAIGLFFSALLKRTQAATVLTYITMLVLTLGTMLLFIFWTVVINQSDNGFGVGPVKRAPEQLLYLNPGIAMLDVVSTTEPGGFGGISGALNELRGINNFGGGVECFGDVCQPVDQFGNPIDGGGNGSSGYWWPRIGITFVVISALLALAAMRMVVPAGMRFAFGRRKRRPLVAAGPMGITDDVIAPLDDPADHDATKEQPR